MNDTGDFIDKNAIFLGRGRCFIDMNVYCPWCGEAGDGVGWTGRWGWGGRGGGGGGGGAGGGWGVGGGGISMNATGVRFPHYTHGPVCPI